VGWEVEDWGAGDSEVVGWGVVGWVVGGSGVAGLAEVA
jgi:hypothetical protein